VAEFRTDTTLPRTFINSWGDLHINERTQTNGTIVFGNFTVTGGTKNFRMVHPLDPTKYLHHSVIEGPEAAVFYRGEGQTVGGILDITLPDYFEALTLPTDRSVLVTPLFEDDAEPFAQLAASRVVNGKFRVRSASDSQKFYWEVKAVRADVAPLEVVTDIPEKDTAPAQTAVATKPAKAKK
jgi:hypothetical protein